MTETPVAASAAPRERQKIRELEVVVSEVVWETPDTVTLVYDGDGPFAYKAGQFLTIKPQQFPALKSACAYFEEVKGKKEPGRAYSMASAPHEKLAITIKAEEYVPGQTKYPPLLSPFLVWGAPVGTKMIVSGFGGPYIFEDEVIDTTDEILHVCAGSGIVPNYALIKDALHRDLPHRHVLVYGNKTWDDIIFRDALSDLARRNADRVRVVHHLTREKDEGLFAGDIRRGRVSRDLLAEFVSDPARAVIYACGPAIGPFDRKTAREKGVEPTPRFLETALGALAELGVPKDRIYYESYG